MHDIHKIYSILAVLAIAITTYVFIFRKPIMQLLKDKLHNPFKSKNLFVGYSATITASVCVLATLVFIVRYFGDAIIIGISIMVFIFTVRTLYYVFKGK